MPCSQIVVSKPIEKDLRISRFLDLAKLLNLVTTQSLHFCRADLLEDQHELLSPDDLHNRPYITKLSQILEASVRPQVFVNSWHISEHETAMMWRAYAGTVAVMSTAGRLMTALDASTENIRVGRVCYHGELLASGASYDTDILSLSKRPNFEEDREFRATLWKENGPPQNPEPPLHRGVYVPVNLGGLVTEIVVSPFSQKWLTSTLESLFKQFGLGHIPLSRSNLCDPPSSLLGR